MSTAIQTIGGTQIIQLGSRLVVGIRVQGTIGWSDPRKPNHLRPRPYLRYLADTLKHLRCDVTLVFNPVGSLGADTHVRHFSQHHFPLPFRWVIDAPLPCTSFSDRRSRQVSRNFSEYFRMVTEEIETSATRVIFIDSEINYRYIPSQTLIIENFEPRKKRLQRERRSTLEPNLSDGLSPSQQRRRDAHQSTIQHTLSSLEHQTSALEEEKKYVAARNDDRATMDDAHEAVADTAARQGIPHGGSAATGSGGGSSSLPPSPSASASLAAPAGASPVPAAPDRSAEDETSRVLTRRMVSAEASHTQRLRDLFQSKAPLAIDNVEIDWTPHRNAVKSQPGAVRALGSATAEPTHETGSPGSSHLGQKPERASSTSQPSDTSGKGASFVPNGNETATEAPVETRLAICKEDFTLVALAEILAELAASEIGVRDYLKVEALVEKIKVPLHGVINYLPIENCDYINMLDWEHVRVQEKERNNANAVPEVVERDEHKDLFK